MIEKNENDGMVINQDVLKMLLRGVWFYLEVPVLLGALIGTVLFCLVFMSKAFVFDIKLRPVAEIYALYTPAKPYIYMSEAIASDVEDSTDNNNVDVKSYADIAEAPYKDVKVSELSTDQIKEIAAYYAVVHNIDPTIFIKLVSRESLFDPNAVSRKNARGLTQLLPSTALEHCNLALKDIHDPHRNLNCGASYIAEQLKEFNNNMRSALAAYNAGPTAVKTYKGVPPYKETKRYVSYICSNDAC